MTGYELTRNWFDFSFEHPDKIKPRHAALYLFIADHCNRLGWKQKFGLPTAYSMEAIGISNHKTYFSTLKDLVDWGFITIVAKSKNQHSSNVVALVKNTKATTTAMDKALLNHCSDTVSIVKPQTGKTLNNKMMSEIEISEVPLDVLEIYKIGEEFRKNIEEFAKSKDIPLKKVSEAKYKSWLDPLIKMVGEDGLKISHLKDLITYLRSTDNQFWQKTVLDTRILRKNSSKILAEIKSKQQFDSNIPVSNSLTKKFNSYG